MGDDLANRWGHQITLVSFGERIGNKQKATDGEESFDTDIGRNYIKSNLCDGLSFKRSLQMDLMGNRFCTNWKRWAYYPMI